MFDTLFIHDENAFSITGPLLRQYIGGRWVRQKGQ